MNINFSISGLAEIRKEFDKATQEIENTVNKALPLVGELMQGQLAMHIQEDVYDQYDPTVYERRAEHPEHGTSISDLGAVSQIVPFKNGVALEYNPDGYYTGPEDPFVPAYDDALIKRIETGVGYDFSSPGPRPFFTNFVEDMIEGNYAEIELVSLINIMDKNIKAFAEGNTVRDSDDWEGF